MRRIQNLMDREFMECPAVRQIIPSDPLPADAHVQPAGSLKKKVFPASVPDVFFFQEFSGSPQLIG